MCIQTVCCWLAIGFFLFLRCHTLWGDTAEGQQKEESTKNPHLTKIQGITPIKSKFCTLYIETGRWFNGSVVTASHSQMKTYVGFDRALENSFSGNDFCEHLLDGEVFFRRHSEHSLGAVTFLVAEGKQCTPTTIILLIFISLTQ